jgi:hypothetical protein
MFNMYLLHSDDGQAIAKEFKITPADLPSVKLLMHRGPASGAVSFVEASDPLSADAMIAKLTGMVRGGEFVADHSGLYTKRQLVSASTYTFDSNKADVTSEVLYAIRSQATPHERVLAEGLRRELTQAGVAGGNIVALHDPIFEKERLSRGYWTVLPWVRSLVWGRIKEGGSAGIKWVLLLEPSSR